MSFKSNLKALNDIMLPMGSGRAFQRLGSTDWNARSPSVRRVFGHLNLSRKFCSSPLFEIKVKRNNWLSWQLNFNRNKREVMGVGWVRSGWVRSNWALTIAACSSENSWLFAGFRQLTTRAPLITTKYFIRALLQRLSNLAFAFAFADLNNCLKNCATHSC